MSLGSQVGHVIREMTSKKTLNQMWKFGTIGLLGVGINLGLLLILVEIFGWYYLHAAVLAIVCAGLSNFTLNKFYTFKDSQFRRLDQGN
ncbi:MAG: GtrA family protein [Nitrososphaerales archaeon]